MYTTNNKIFEHIQKGQKANVFSYFGQQYGEILFSHIIIQMSMSNKTYISGRFIFPCLVQQVNWEAI